MKEYNPKEIEAKWQEIWEEEEVFKTPADATPENKAYVLPQLPYPSGSGLHVGHAEVYTACDIYARYLRMKGKKVLQVFGLDSFGLPAENYAIKTNVHPRETIDKTGEMFVSQVKSLGISVDWDRFVRSSDPGYYKFTQWFFLLMYERGLAYRKKQSVNWCDGCKTVLANEQVVDGKCERSDDVVVQKEMEQWYLKITDYADRLLADLDKIDWPEETKMRQRNWIGRSEGAEIDFEIQNSEFRIPVFTTAHDTIYGVSFMVLAPEHELVATLLEETRNPERQANGAGKKQETIVENIDEVEKYIKETSKKTELDRQTQKEKTGVELKGIKAINPINGKEISVWISDYVLATYGTGSIMAVPGADERDYEFAKKFGLEVISVVDSKEEFVSYAEIKKDKKKFKLINSEEFDGFDYEEGRKKILQKIVDGGYGESKVQYKLRDWSVSRQRFWGAPLPILVNEQEAESKRQYVFIHGRGGTAESDFWPWLKAQVEAKGHKVVVLDLPNTEIPNATEQANYLFENIKLDKDTVVVAHSHGGPVAFHLLAKTKQPIAKLVLIDTMLRPEFNDGKEREFRDEAKLQFDFASIKDLPQETVVIADKNYPIIKKEQIDEQVNIFDARVVYASANEDHLTGLVEPAILEEVFVSGLKPVPEKDLPVLLPSDVDFKPTGQSPLTYSEEFQKGVEEKYGAGWKREVDTLDTFMCSSWYYFRYLDPNNENEFASPESLKAWMPVDFYLGGEEHVNGHLLYSRFFTKVLFDAGYIDFDEPFTKNRHQGLILGEDNRKMSKRWGNVINPTDVVNEFGADTLRTYEMFMGPLEQTKPWNDDGVKGVRRFLDRWYDYFAELKENIGDNFAVYKNGEYMGENNPEFEKLLHKSIKKIGEDLDGMRFNTAVSQLMILRKNIGTKEVPTVNYSSVIAMQKLMAPFAPHLAEEIAGMFEFEEFVSLSVWPEYDKEKIVDDVVKIAVQVNGKVRATIEVPAEISEEEVKKTALEQENVIKWLEGKEPKKVIYVKGRLVSVVV